MNTPSTQQKVFIEEQDLMVDGFKLGKKIFESDFRPDFYRRYMAGRLRGRNRGAGMLAVSWCRGGTISPSAPLMTACRAILR